MSRFENSYSPKPDRTGWLTGLLMVIMLVLIVWGASACSVSCLLWRV